MDRFRFQNAELQQTLERLYAAAGIPCEVGDDGALHCDEAFGNRAEALRAAVRCQRFPDWHTQCIADGSEQDAGDYRAAVLADLAARAVPFELEEHDGESWLLLPEEEIVPDSVWESVYGSVTTFTRTNPGCCFCEGTIGGDVFAEISVRRPDGAFRSVLYAHQECLRERVRPQALHVIDTVD